jgi:CRP/FNR family transcriptional regulator
MQTMSHLSLQPAVGARAMGGFEESLARAPLRRVEAKEFVFAEGDPTAHVLTTGQRSAAERVVSFLLAFSRRSERNGQSPSEFDLPMTRADIGDFLGLTIETVSRTFTKLRTLGLIELLQSHRVKVLDIVELGRLASGEDREG